MDRARTLQRRAEDIRELLDSQTEGTRNGAPAVVGVTAHLKEYPDGSPAFYWIQIQDVGGEFREGGTPTFSPTGFGILACNIGRGKPPEGAPVLATFEGGAWFFRYDA